MPMPEQRTNRNSDTSSRSPNTINSVEHFFRGGGGDSARMSPTYSPTDSNSPSSSYFERFKQQDPEEDPGLYQKKSVLTKVKEKAKKFRNSLSKRRQEDDCVTPSWGVSLDDDEEQQDPEYLGAPMYESELAPEAYKENARQHPRANPVISEKHVLPNTVKLGVQQDNEEPEENSADELETTQNMTTTPSDPVNNSFTTTPSDRVNNSMTTTPNRTAENIAQKLIPVCASDSKTTRFLSSKIQAAVSTASSHAPNNLSSQTSASSAPLTSSDQSPMQNSTSSSGPVLTKCKSRKGATVGDYLMSEPGDEAKTVSPMQSSPALSASLSGKSTSLKSAPAKDYLTSEPRHDAKTVSPMQSSPALSASLSGKSTSLKSAPAKDYLTSEPRHDARTVSPMQSSPALSASLSGKNTSLKSAPAKDYLTSDTRNDAKTVSPMQSSPALSASLSGKNTSFKRASARDYYLTSDTRNDAKTVSQPQVTPEATSETRTSSNAGIMNNVIGAVNSLIGNDESSQKHGVKNPTTSNSSQNIQVEKEENQGRILQEN